MPKTRARRLLRWIEKRTGLNLILKVSLDEPIPGGASWAYIFGSGLLFIFISQVITGICLAIYYVPSAQNAHVSVAYITKQVAAGDFLRSLHYYGSSAMVIVLALHFLQTFLYGAYKGRRELLWISGGVLAFLVLGMAFTGYLLPWDQKAYFATAVGTNIVSEVPLVGGWIARLMRGGDTIGTLTLSRFYIAHLFLIPGCIFAFIATHIYLFRKAGAAGPVREDPIDPKLPPESFYPKQVLMDMGFAMVLMSALGFLAHFRPVELGPRANPAAANYLPRPEWYYLPMFEWLKFWEGSTAVLGIVVIPALLALLFFLLPFLDRSFERRPWRRPVPLLAVSFVLLGVIYLGGLSRYQDMHDPTVRRQLILQAAEEKAYTESPFQPFMQAPGAINLIEPASANPTVARGKALFADNGCSGCHGPRGRGAIGPSLVGIGKKFAPDALVALLRNPSPAMRSAGMPVPDLSTPHLRQLVAYLDALGTPAENVAAESSSLPESANAAPAPAALNAAASVAPGPAGPASAEQSAAGSGLIDQGHQVFQAHACFACHGPAAQGTARAPALAGWAARTSPAVIRMHIEHPTPAMQAKGMVPVALPPDQLNAVVAFLRSLPAPARVAAPSAQHVPPLRQPAPPPPPEAVPAAPSAASSSHAPSPSDIAAGQALFAQHACLACHGAQAQGTKIGPALAGISRQLPEQTFAVLINHPLPEMTAKGMPPAGLSARQTHQLWAYLNSLPVPAHEAPLPILALPSQPVASSPAPAAQPEASAAPAKQPAPVPASQPQVESAAVQLSAPAAAGEKIFNSHGCIACHGVNGIGTPLAVSLIGVTNKYSHQQLADLIRHPNARMKAGGMPTFSFTDPEIENLIAYLAQLRKPSSATATGAEEPSPARHAPPPKLTAEEQKGREIYFQARCSTCHGGGGMEGTAAAPSLTATASELPPDMIQHLLEHPSSAMQSHGMPPVSLNPADLKALISYIRALRYNR